MDIQIKYTADIERLMKWRKEVILNVFGEEASPDILAANRHYYSEALAAGRHIAIELLYDGKPAGCGGLCFQRELPSPDNPSGLSGYLMNIYVRKAYRHLGLATKIVETLVDEAFTRGAGKVTLESTEMALPVYKSLGFKTLPNYFILWKPQFSTLEI